MKLPVKRIHNLIAACLRFVAMGTFGIVLFSYLLPQDLTRTTRIYSVLVEVSFFGRVFTFQASLILVLVGICSVILRRWRLATLAVFIAIGFAAPTLINLLPREATKSSGPVLRIMSMNLKYTRSDPDRIVGQIKKFNPDVIVLQDYTPFAKVVLDLEFKNDYLHRYLQSNTLQGLAIFSRLPFDGRPQVIFSKTRRQMRSVIVFHDQPIVVYVEHPFSPRTRQRIINNRLATVDLVQQFQSEKLPTIIAGDFNFTTETPNETTLKSVGLQDAFEQSGHGRGSTWPVDPHWLQWLPGVRIDHIFISAQLISTQFFVGEYDGSDHLPIVADIGLSPAK
jgi:endonuclease/exonuclease/phosphatase (EEP) superfamily protein YafD